MDAQFQVILIINSGFNISENILLIRSTAVYKNGSTFSGKQTTCKVEFVCLDSGLVSAPLIIPFLFSPCVCKTFCFETRSQSCLQEEFQRLKILTPNPSLRIENNNLLVLILFIAQQLPKQISTYANGSPGSLCLPSLDINVYVQNLQGVLTS